MSSTLSFPEILGSDWPSVVQEIRLLAATTAEPQATLDRIEQIIRTHGEQQSRLTGFLAGLRDPVWRQRLVAVLGNSPYLSHVILRWPGFVTELQQQDGYDLPPTARMGALVAASAAVAPRTEHREEIAALLRWFKHREYLRIGMRDLTGQAPLLETTGDLAAIADICLEVGYRWLERWLTARHGRPWVEMAGERHPSRFVILGMGKLGARELNFSSDIDLIFLYDEDKGGTDGPHPISLKAYYIRLGQELIKLLQEQTADGRVFRVDLRLRPDGESGDLSLSTRSAEIYYESWGQTWERAAMIKARPVAGDLELGAGFLRKIQPFVYRRFLDFSAVEAIREMKRKIDHKVVQAADYLHNLKLGYGGIREIEFFVQTHQLIHGGKEPRLRQRESLLTLQTMGQLGLVSQATVTTLTGAYELLRHTEHRLQIVLEQQVHSLPKDPAEMERLAKRLRMSDGTALRQLLEEVREQVHGIYGTLFFEGERAAAAREPDPLVERLLACDPSSADAMSLLQEVGFQQPKTALGLLQLLRDGPRGLSLTETVRRRYGRLAPMMLAEVLQAPDRDLALHHAEAFLTRMGARPSYIAMLLENPAILNLLVRLFGSSGLLSRFLTNHPELLDHLLSRDFLNQYRDRSALAGELTRMMAEAGEDEEERMRLIRRFKNTEMLRLGLRDLAGTVDLTEVMAGLATLADVAVGQVVLDARADLERRHGIPGWTDKEGQRHRAHFAVLALGKLGGSELNYASDLDLIFIHDSTGDDTWTDGARSMANGPFFARLGQKVMTWITTMTSEGKLYDLDMRLRPSGNSGPLVISLEAFLQYQHHEAWTWEHQALTRARVISGEAELATRLRNEIQTILTMPRDPEKVRSEVMEMRQRLIQEKLPSEDWIDIKQSRGGIVDCEFLVQYLILIHGAGHPRIVRRNLDNALWAFQKEGLLPADQADILLENYRFYRLVENRLRLLLDRSENRIGPDDTIRRHLARLLALPEDTDLINELRQRFERVYSIYHMYLEA